MKLLPTFVVAGAKVVVFAQGVATFTAFLAGAILFLTYIICQWQWPDEKGYARHRPGLYPHWEKGGLTAAAMPCW